MFVEWRLWILGDGVVESGRVVLEIKRYEMKGFVGSLFM